MLTGQSRPMDHTAALARFGRLRGIAPTLARSKRRKSAAHRSVPFSLGLCPSVGPWKDDAGHVRPCGEPFADAHRRGRCQKRLVGDGPHAHRRFAQLRPTSGGTTTSASAAERRLTVHLRAPGSTSGAPFRPVGGRRRRRRRGPELAPNRVSLHAGMASFKQSKRRLRRLFLALKSPETPSSS